ncbi:MAG TPA: tetratricopeptide repeat protein [Microlunatus sp.]|nr:tetratricopeptide repeat protein [Microlunatus sp.]
MSTSSFSRHGAVDLSQLAQKAKQPPPSAGIPTGAGGRTAGGGSYVVELTEQTFESVAIRASMQYPVIVEFYSSSRATAGSQELSTALADVASSSDGKFLLGRLDIDTAQQIAGAIGLQAVPTVVALIGGQLAPLFQGAVPAEQLGPVIDSVLKAAVTNGIVGRAEPLGAAAEETVDSEPGPDPRFAEADAALERGDFAAAEAEFDKLLQANPADAEAKAGKAQAGLLVRASKLDAQVVMLAASSATAPLPVHLDAADLELASGRVEDAFTRLIGQVKARSGDERDQARKRLLELFETVGNADPRVLKARRDLMTALF